MSNIKVIVVLLLVMSATLYMYSTKIESKPALDIIITTGFDENGTIKVTNMTFEQTSVPFFYKTTDNRAEFPEINVIARYNSITSEPSSYWASYKYNPETEGKYILKVVFRTGKEPNVEDLLILPVKITDFRGNVIYKTTAFYGWK
jgi:hypothetical protein